MHRKSFRARTTAYVVSSGLACLAGCEAGNAPGTPALRDDLAEPKVTPEGHAQARAEGVPTSPGPGAAPPADKVHFSDGIAWTTWERGLVRAQRENRPILALVYADWCSKCRSLGQALDDKEISALSRKFVMVKQEHGDNVEWLKPYNAKYGTYVPRIFFFDAKGSVHDEVTSGNPRYPYFYDSAQLGVLKQRMREVAGS